MLRVLGWAGAGLASATCLLVFPSVGDAAVRVRNEDVRRRELSREQHQRRSADIHEKMLERKKRAQAFQAAQQAEEAALADLRTEIEKLMEAGETAQATEKQSELNRRLRQLWERQEEWSRDQQHLDSSGGLVAIFRAKPPGRR